MRTLLSILLLVSASAPAFAAVTLEDLQHRWAIANYQAQEDEVEAIFTQLIADVDQAIAANGADAELLIWQGIIKSSYAGKLGGLGALGLVKEARKSLEAAIKVNDEALAGSAYTSLGALYYQVPGWPVAFGNDKKARQMLEKALKMNPDGIDSNYFYADFLVSENEFEAAEVRLNKALQAPARPGREIADAGRREEIRALLSKIEKELES